MPQMMSPRQASIVFTLTHLIIISFLAFLLGSLTILCMYYTIMYLVEI